jgi:hypothetical protein
MPPVGRVDVTAADAVGAAPITSIEMPADGGKPLAVDWRNVAAMALANHEYIEGITDDLDTEKVDVAGDTMTGTLTISPSGAVAGLVVSAGPASGQTAIQGTGNGIGQGAVFAGGTSGAGGTAQAGGGNNFGWRGIGAGNEVGGEFTGGTSGAGVRARAGTAATDAAPTYSILAVDGGMHMNGVVSPDPDVDPGVDFAQFPQSMVTSSAIVRSLGGNTFDLRNGKGFNVLSFSGNASGVATVTFKRNLPGNDYRIQVFPPDGYLVGWNGVQNVGNFQFTVRDAATNAVVDLTTTALAFQMSTVGF